MLDWLIDYVVRYPIDVAYDLYLVYVVVMLHYFLLFHDGPAAWLWATMGVRERFLSLIATSWLIVMPVDALYMWAVDGYETVDPAPLMWDDSPVVRMPRMGAAADVEANP